MANGKQMAGIFIGGFGVAATLRVAFHDGGGMLLLVGLVCIAVGGYLIFQKQPGPASDGSSTPSRSAWPTAPNDPPPPPAVPPATFQQSTPVAPLSPSSSWPQHPASSSTWPQHPPSSASRPESSAAEPVAAVSAATHRKCPYCAEEIRAEAIKCRYCGSTVEAISRPS